MERIAFARRLVATTDRAFTAVTSSGAIARLLRLHLVPLLLPPLFLLRWFRHLAFRTVSQTVVNYRGSWLSAGRAGAVLGGDRLPWVKIRVNGDERDNFAPLTSLDWQVHVYGEAAPEIRTMCEERRLALHVFPWHRAMDGSGLLRNAVYLVRPDGYVGLADANGCAAPMTSYLEARALYRRP